MSLPSFSEGAVELSAADAEELARLVGLLLKRECRSSDCGSHRASRLAEPSSRIALVLMANALLAERERRSECFNPVMFSEPAWDMLLVLYINDFEGCTQTIGKLIGSIGTPQTTALRWIDYLEKERLISREPHPRDRRTVVVNITNKGREKLDDYLSTISFRLIGDASRLSPSLRGQRCSDNGQSKTEESARR